MERYDQRFSFRSAYGHYRLWGQLGVNNSTYSLAGVPLLTPTKFVIVDSQSVKLGTKREEQALTLPKGERT